jgi:hypothetical protein
MCRAGLLLVVSTVVFFHGVCFGSQRECRLVLQLTVDQLRGDALMKLERRFTGGFRYLIDNGIWYTNAHYQHSTTFTAVGHAVLVTGGYPAQHGIIGNDWIDRETRQHVYCYADMNHRVLGREPSMTSATSPRNLTGSTIADEIYVATGGKAKVFSVSIKDRAAIPCGGHLGKAFWYDKGAGEFTTSTYYYTQTPAWVQTWNTSKPADKYLGRSWQLLFPKETYLHGNEDDRACERPYGRMRRTFPHPVGDSSNRKAFYSTLRFVPFGDWLTLEFARELFEQEQLGRSNATDYFSVSLSATDYIGHCFGPFSLEYEDNLLQLDRLLGEFFVHLDQRIGLQNILIVFTSDHGTDAIPEYRLSLTPAASQRHASGGPDDAGHETWGGRHYPDRFIATLNAKLKQRFSVDRDLIVAFWNPNLYLDLKAVQEAGVDRKLVAEVLAEAVTSFNGFAAAVSYDAMKAGRLPQNDMSRKMSNAFNPRRSGDVMIIQRPFWYLYHDPEEFGAMHGSPYTYDTHVPVIFAGRGIKGSRLARPIEPTAIAATIAAYLRQCPPSGCIGIPLEEVLESEF